MNKGDIVLISFPFTDLLLNKNRPAVILIESEDDVTVCFITTQLKWQYEFDILIQPSDLTGQIHEVGGSDPPLATEKPERAFLFYLYCPSIALIASTNSCFKFSGSSTFSSAPYPISTIISS